MSNKSKPKAVLNYLVSSLVQQTEDVVISEVEDDLIVYEVQVGEGEMGKVIGKRGRTAQAVRSIVRSVSAADDTRATVDFVD